MGSEQAIVSVINSAKEDAAEQHRELMHKLDAFLSVLGEIFEVLQNKIS